jgi:hypothetical protein
MTSGGTEETGFEDDAQDTGTRQDRVEHRLDRIEAALARLVPKSRADSEARVESRLDRPTDVQEQVRAELARAEEEQAAARAEEQAKAETETVSQRLAKLEETPPAPPVRRATRALGWGDGR